MENFNLKNLKIFDHKTPRTMPIIAHSTHIIADSTHINNAMGPIWYRR